MASFNFVPVLKLTALLADISMGCPVAGFLPVRAARSFTDKLANPGNTIESPLASNSVKQLITAFNAVSESVLLSPDVSLIACHGPRLLLHPVATQSAPLRLNFL